MTRLTKHFVVLTTVLLLAAVPAVASAVGGFAGPVFGLGTAPNGDLLVADAAQGVVPVRDGATGPALPVPGATDVSAIGRNAMWVTTGAGADPTRDTGQALHRVTRGTAREIVNLFEFEAAVNPDGNEPFDSNPFDVQSLGGHAALVADAGANALLRVDTRGGVEVVAVFPDELVPTDDIRALVGCPDAPEPLAGLCGLPPQLPAQAVPTSIAIGPDGGIYVGELKGFPAPAGESNIWRVAPGASEAECGASPDCVKVFDGGFTSIIDLAFGPDGRLHVAELDEASWAAVEILMAPTGGTVNACDVGTLTCEQVAGGIPELTAITFGRDGTLWATRNAVFLGAPEVVELS